LAFIAWPEDSQKRADSSTDGMLPACREKTKDSF
jgi:hypothetical protein